MADKKDCPKCDGTGVVFLSGGRVRECHNCKGTGKV